MEPTISPYEDGDLRGAVYRFASKGDAIPEHLHDAASNHVTFVIKGSIQAIGPDWTQTGGPGTLLSFVEGSPHSIVAEEDGTVILNLLKNPEVEHVLP